MPENWILLIDPCKNLHPVYRFLLEGEGYQVETAFDLKEASHRILLRTYTSVIIEYLPPLEEISHMFQRIKEQTPETYILMVTDAIVDDSTYDQLLAIGVDDLIFKPCSPLTILVQIKKGERQRDLFLRKRDLERQAILDPLAEHTQQYIFSPTYLRKCFWQELKKARRHQGSFSLLLIEIPPKDKLGDRFEGFCIDLLKMLRRSTRAEDLVGRENGNVEILLPETNGAGSDALMSRLSNLVQTSPLFQSDEVLRPVVQQLSFRSFTYPGESSIPASLKKALEEVIQESPYH